MINDYLIYKPQSKNELQYALDLWCVDKIKALKLYEHISLWNTSLITNMSSLFKNKKYFNDNISNWNVSNVTSMFFMFYKCTNFNQPLENWNVSKVTNMIKMFRKSQFNQPIEKWNVSNVKNKKNNKR